MLGRRTRSLVGLDIGSSAVKAVELRPAGGGFRVSAAASEPLPTDSIVGGAIQSHTTVSNAIRALFERHDIRSADVAVALAGSAVIVRRLSLPVMNEEELGQAIYWEAKDSIPFDIDDVNLDYQVLDSQSGAPETTTRDILLVAAKKDRIGDYTSVIAEAGCRPTVVDVDAFALQNAYELNYGLPQDGMVALLNAGASTININVLRGRQSVFTRDLATGGNAYTVALAEELDLSFEEADRLKKGVPVRERTYEDAEPVIKAVTDNLLLEIAKTFDFFEATSPSTRIDSIVLSGGSARIDGLAEALAARFETEVNLFDPFRRMAPLNGLAPEQLDDMGPSAAVAVGLALRKADDR